MADKKGSKGGSSTTRKPTTVAGGMPGSVTESGINMSLSAPNPNFPAGMFAQSLGGEANVSDTLGDLAPTFGEVLRSIGMGVATSQTALDQGLVSTAATLSATKIELVTQVIQQLDEDGLPNPGATELQTKKVSLINYINPQAHEWKHVSLSMDLSVGAMDVESGVTFTQSQNSSSVATTGLLWGFVGWFDDADRGSYNRSTRETDRETEWEQGQVRMDAMLGPRRTSKFPVPAEVTIGPSLSFAQGAVSELASGGVVTERSLEVSISVRKADGSVNPDKTIEVVSDRFIIEYLDNGNPGGFNKSNSDGIVIVAAKRAIHNSLFMRTSHGSITANLGRIDRTLDISL